MGHPFSPQPCEGCPPEDDGQHAAQPKPCDLFVSQGFGIRGDYEHSLFCRCGWEHVEHEDCACLKCCRAADEEERNA